ncbi:MAG: asparagine--tRNA ligase [Defluviitaleaceae bacterium]|nr:asparagine--tRNA ligase [Defluviitaleaceae bacterium]
MEQTLQFCGWVRSIRKGAGKAFVDLNDGTSLKGIQIVVDPQEIAVEEISTGASVKVEGTLVESLGKGQSYEIKATTVTVIGKSPAEYPLQKKHHTREYLRTIAHLRPKANIFLAVFRIRSLAGFAAHQFFNERSFVHVHSPIITPFDAEGAGEMFHVATNPTLPPEEDFFGKKAFLTVSGQLSAETFAQAFKNVYTFGPTFRAENSNTKRHAAEFWMLEPEIAFADLDDIIELATDMLKHIICYVLEQAKDELEFLEGVNGQGLVENLQNLVKADFKKVTYTQSIEILQAAIKEGKAKFEFPVEWGKELQTEHERYLAEQVYKGPVFVTDYPKDIKAFYMRLNDDGKTVAATDLLVPGIGELIGGSQREERENVLIKKMEAQGIDPEHYSWYVDLRRFGTVPHAGYGLGFERLIMYITAMENIRDVIPFPRTVNSLDF